MTDDLDGTSEMIRCARCHGIYEIGLEACPRCGTPYRPIPVAAAPYEGSYAERYSGTEFALSAEETPPPVIPSTGPRVGLVVALGGMMIVLALIIGLLYFAGAFGGGGKAAPEYVFAATPAPSAAPTLPPSVAQTMFTLRDINLSAHIKVQSRATVDARVTGKAQSIIANMDITISGGNESGTLTIGAIAKQFMLVNGVYYDRTAVTGKWAARTILPPALLVSPLFGLNENRQLQLVGSEVINGQTLNHFRSTGWWTPDQSRLSLFDVSGLGIKATKTILDLYATLDGSPVSATFSATQDTNDGSVHLLDIEVSWTFDQVGVPVTIEAPIAGPTPTAAPSVKATPS